MIGAGVDIENPHAGTLENDISIEMHEQPSKGLKSNKSSYNELYSPVNPVNAPAILTYSKLNVSTKTNPSKTLLNNVCGSITGGFWAIMGKVKK